MTHLDRPFVGVPVLITQEYGNGTNAFEPVGYKHTDGSIGYVGPEGGTIGHWHNGIDYGIPCGTPLRAPLGGVVSLVGISPSGFGLRLEIDHGELLTIYGHLTRIDVVWGQALKRDQHIALSGGGNGDQRDGNSTGCHLHWSLVSKVTGRYISPVPYVFGDV